MVCDPEGASDDGGHPRQGPEVGAETVGRRPFEEQLEEPRPLPRCQARWLKDHSPHGATYVCQHSSIMDLLTERKCYECPFSRDSNKLLELLRKERIRYLLIDKKKLEVQKFLPPVIYAHPSRFSLIKDEKAAALYEFNVANASSVSEAR
jgi:hypothetical protein